MGERKGLTMKERLHKCQQTERQRITFGKVSLIPCMHACLHVLAFYRMSKQPLYVSAASSKMYLPEAYSHCFFSPLSMCREGMHDHPGSERLLCFIS